MPKITVDMVNQAILLAREYGSKRAFPSAEDCLNNSAPSQKTMVQDAAEIKKLLAWREKVLTNIAHQNPDLFDVRAQRVRNKFKVEMASIFAKYIQVYSALKAYPESENLPYLNKVKDMTAEVLGNGGFDLSECKAQDLFDCVDFQSIAKPVGLFEGDEAYNIEAYKGLQPDSSVSIAEFVSTEDAALVKPKIENKIGDIIFFEDKNITEPLIVADKKYLVFSYDANIIGKELDIKNRIETLNELMNKRLPEIKAMRNQCLEKINTHNKAKALSSGVIAQFESSFQKLASFNINANNAYVAKISEANESGDISYSKELQSEKETTIKNIEKLTKDVENFRNKLKKEPISNLTSDEITRLYDEVDTYNNYIKAHYHPLFKELFYLEGKIAPGKKLSEVELNTQAEKRLNEFEKTQNEEFNELQADAKRSRESYVNNFLKESKVITDAIEELSIIPEALNTKVKSHNEIPVSDLYTKPGLSTDIKEPLPPFKKPQNPQPRKEISQQSQPDFSAPQRITNGNFAILAIENFQKVTGAFRAQKAKNAFDFTDDYTRERENAFDALVMSGKATDEQKARAMSDLAKAKLGSVMMLKEQRASHSRAWKIFRPISNLVEYVKLKNREKDAMNHFEGFDLDGTFTQIRDSLKIESKPLIATSNDMDNQGLQNSIKLDMEKDLVNAKSVTRNKQPVKTKDDLQLRDDQ